jgi:hypothetical protein
MAANIKIKKIVKNSKMKRFQWKWIFTESKTCCTILRPFRFAMAAILNPKWPPKYINSPIWAKFGFQVDYDVANWYPNFTGMLSTIWVDVQTTFGIFKMTAVAMETTKNTKKLKCSELDETFQKFCLTCVHIILRLSNFKMTAVATKNVKHLMCSELDET